MSVVCRVGELSYSAKIIADTAAPCGARLVTFEVTIPKWIQAEFNTHRMISRNSASSRAIPVAKMLERVRDNPVIPVWWGKNQSGMSARDELSTEDQGAAESIWRLAGSYMLNVVKSLSNIGLHKQVANRLLEPWMFTTVIASATEWSNFFALRCHPDAQPEFHKVAMVMRTLYNTSQPRNGGNPWHTPYVDEKEWEALTAAGMSTKDILMVSAGRCARVSYLTHDGIRDPKADIDLCEKLISSGHMSPLEHVARACTIDEWWDWSDEEDWALNRVPTGNFWGFHQLRKYVANEHDFARDLGKIPDGL